MAEVCLTVCTAVACNSGLRDRLHKWKLLAALLGHKSARPASPVASSSVDDLPVERCELISFATPIASAASSIMALQSLRAGVRLATRPSCSFVQTGLRGFASATTEQQVCVMVWNATDVIASTLPHDCRCQWSGHTVAQVGSTSVGSTSEGLGLSETCVTVLIKSCCCAGCRGRGRRPRWLCGSH